MAVDQKQTALWKRSTSITRYSSSGQADRGETGCVLVSDVKRSATFK